MNSILHLLRDFFSAISYFSLSLFTWLPFRYHFPEQRDRTGSLSVQHDRLTLEDLAAKTSSESTVRPFGKGPTSKNIVRNGYPAKGDFRTELKFSKKILYYSILLHLTLLLSTLLYSTLLYSTLLYSTLLYSTL